MRSWEGSLPALRVSPKWSIGDAMRTAMVKVKPSRPSGIYGGYDPSKRVQPWRQPPVEKARRHAGSNMSGEVRGSSNLKSSMDCSQTDSMVAVVRGSEAPRMVKGVDKGRCLAVGVSQRRTVASTWAG
jgi:hypothetical protein